MHWQNIAGIRSKEPQGIGANPLKWLGYEIGCQKEVVPIPSKKDKLVKLKQDFERIRQLLKIINTESCLLVYSYLMLFGRTTPAKLREATGLSKATMFRNLALLSDAEVLSKEEVDVSDMRYSLHYYISKNLLDEAKSLSSKGIQEYAAQTNNIGIFERWVMSLETLPLTLNRFVTELLLSVTQDSQTTSKDECTVITKMVAFRVGDIANLTRIIEIVRNLVKTFDTESGSTRRNWRKPLDTPATMTVSLVAMGSEIPTDPTAVAVKRIEC
ncbi:MAG: hypothetical protein AM326_03480 [Candidatus Thorarchaeota archaeon SMTZ-45]|nr:MAG: hypothetical protein AM326_03480 [Candidatus Thorarchaeota archaeon SMTZ-45]